MIVFGLISSVFDLLGFALLIYVFHAPELVFQTAWFVLSLLTELAVVMVLRRQGLAWRSRPGGLLVAITAGVGLVAFVLPFTGPLARLFGLTPLALPLLGAMTLLVTGYLVLTEAAKLLFFRAAARGSRPNAPVTPEARASAPRCESAPSTAARTAPRAPGFRTGWCPRGSSSSRCRWGRGVVCR